jgi:glycosyltransferase involved in cell wall biosynthesis
LTVLMTADAVGGVWRYSLDLATALRGRGVRITIAVIGPAPSMAQRREALRAGIPVIDAPYRLEWMDDADADVEQAGRWLLTLEKALRPDLVHLNGYAHAALPWSTPVVVVAHSCVRTWWRAVRGDLPPSRFDSYTAAVTAGLAAARVVIAPTAAMLAALADEYSVSFAGQVIPNGCATSRHQRETVDARKQPFILAAGRAWDEAKNIAGLCAVAPQITWPVYVAGETQPPDGTNCSLSGVRHLGHLSSRQLSDWYRRAAIYALPARYEPFGLSVLEAARAGCALVLGDIPSLRENWDGAALFVAPDNHQALTAGIQTLINQPDARAEQARRAVTRAATFTMERSVDQYLRVYEGLVA